jgi:hypothetical protein
MKLASGTSSPASEGQGNTNGTSGPHQQTKDERMNQKTYVVVIVSVQFNILVFRCSNVSLANWGSSFTEISYFDTIRLRKATDSVSLNLVILLVTVVRKGIKLESLCSPSSYTRASSPTERPKSFSRPIFQETLRFEGVRVLPISSWKETKGQCWILRGEHEAHDYNANPRGWSREAFRLVLEWSSSRHDCYYMWKPFLYPRLLENVTPNTNEWAIIDISKGLKQQEGTCEEFRRKRWKRNFRQLVRWIERITYASEYVSKGIWSWVCFNRQILLDIREIMKILQEYDL